MEELIEKLITYLLPQSNLFLYLFLFISAVVENLFPPIPGDTITAFGAFLVGTGRLSYILVYIATTLGSTTGFLILFYLGRFLGREFFIEKDYKFFTKEQIIKSEVWYRKYGYFIVLLNRFMPGIRSVISISSGIMKLSPIRVIIFSIISAAIWNLIWIQAGFMLGNNWGDVKKNISTLLTNYNKFAIGAIVVIIILTAIFKIYKKKKNLKK